MASDVDKPKHELRYPKLNSNLIFSPASILCCNRKGNQVHGCGKNLTPSWTLHDFGTIVSNLVSNIYRIKYLVISYQISCNLANMDTQIKWDFEAHGI